MKTTRELREESAALGLLGAMLAISVPASEALRLAAKEFPAFDAPFNWMANKIAALDYPSEGLIENRGQLSLFVPGLVRAGVMFGSLDIAFTEAADILDRRAYLRSVRGVNIQPDDLIGIDFLRMVSALVGKLGCNSILEAIELSGNVGLPSAMTAAIKQSIRDGSTLQESLKPYPTFFDELTCSYVLAGELSGSLPKTCRRAADIKEHTILASYPADLSFPTPTPASLGDIACYDTLALTYYGTPGQKGYVIFPANIGKVFGREAFTLLAKKVNTDHVAVSLAMRSLPEHFPPYIAAIVERGETECSINAAFELITIYLKWRHLGIKPLIDSIDSLILF